MPIQLSTHFQDTEMRCPCRADDCSAPTLPNPALIDRLETLRVVVGKPIVITSGIRCATYNRFVGGEEPSAHLTGDAADLAVATSRDVYWLLRVILQRDLFHRIGYGRRDRDKNITLHVDVSDALPQRVVWTY